MRENEKIILREKARGKGRKKTYNEEERMSGADTITNAVCEKKQEKTSTGVRAGGSEKWCLFWYKGAKKKRVRTVF